MLKRLLSIRSVKVFYFPTFCMIAIIMFASLPFTAQARVPSWQGYVYNGPTGSRWYFVYTPPSYHVGMVVPLVVMLHGCEQTAADFANGTQMNQVADHYTFIVVYPQEADTANAANCWNWDDPANQTRGSGEAAIIAGIAETIEQNTLHWTIDPHRVYVAGLSAGGALSVILGATYPDIFAAIGVHSGVEYQAATNPVDGETVLRQGGPDPAQQGRVAFNAMGEHARVVPTVVFHGTDDPITNPINGDQVVQQWMQTDTLASNGTYQATFSSPTSITDGQIPGGHTYTTSVWRDSEGGDVQEYWKVNGMGHGWSGGNSGGSYTDPLGPNASIAMYMFFINHPV